MGHPSSPAGRRGGTRMKTARYTLGGRAAVLLAGTACSDETSPTAEPLDAPAMMPAPSPAAGAGGSAPSSPLGNGPNFDADDDTLSEGAPNPVGLSPETPAPEPTDSAGCSGGSLA